MSVGTQVSSTVQILGNGQVTTQDGLTIVRLRGFVELILTSASALGDGFDGAIGIGIVSAPAFAIGVTAVPTPITEIEWEGWLWHQFFSLTAPTAAQDSENRQVFEVDSKAMRKINSEEVVYAAIEVTETGTAGLKAKLGTRMLLKLP